MRQHTRWVAIPDWLPDALTAIHYALTTILLALGLLLLLPVNTFDGSRSWRLFAEAGSENTWAILLWTLGLSGVMGLITEKRVVRFASVAIMATAHGAMALMFVWSNPSGGASIIYAVIAMLGYYLLVRRFEESRRGAGHD